MYPIKIRLKNLLLGVLSCLLVVGFCSPSIGMMSQATLSQSPKQVEQSLAESLTLGEVIDANLQAAESVLIAQGQIAQGRSMSSGLRSYVAIMSPNNVVPSSPATLARGVVGAVLSGDRLIVRGSFRELSSTLRDYATDPVDPPNPNITSAFHIHRGMPNENGPFQYALQVMLDESGRKGSAMGEYTLTAEQLEALNNNMLYVDLHTSRNRGGELRAVLMPM